MALRNIKPTLCSTSTTVSSLPTPSAQPRDVLLTASTFSSSTTKPSPGSSSSISRHASVADGRDHDPDVAARPGCSPSSLMMSRSPTK
jgi:hypothetical protein